MSAGAVNTHVAVKVESLPDWSEVITWFAWMGGM